MNKKIVALGVIAVLMVGAGAGYWRWTKSPTYSLKQLALAVKDHDRDAVEKYLDIEAVANETIDFILSKALAEKTPANQMQAAGQNLARGFVEMMKPRLAQTAKEKFLSYVESGKIEDTPGESGPVAGITSSLKAVSSGSVEFLGIESVKREGKIAEVKVKLRGANKQELAPILRMREKDGFWQIFGVGNLAELFPETPAEGQPVITDMTIAIPTFEKLLASQKSEMDLRSDQVRKVHHKGDERVFTESVTKRWSDECSKDANYTCRLLSYVQDIEGDSRAAQQALTRGCSSEKDYLACIGLSARQNLPKDALDMANQAIASGCKKHDATACFIAGTMTKDPKKKLNLFGESCAAKNPDACVALIEMKIQAKLKSDALKLASQACSDSHGDACFLAGSLSEDDKNVSEAMAHYQEGCQAGNGRSCLGLSRLNYSAGKADEAVKSWIKACNGLEGSGCFMIGLYLTEKNGKDQKVQAQSKQMFERGCWLGDTESCQKIGMRKPAGL